MTTDKPSAGADATDGSNKNITPEQEQYMQDLPDGTTDGLVDDDQESDDSEVSSGKKS
jgi:hypothetical protein